MRVLLNGSSHEVSSAPPVTVKKLLAELGLVGPVAVEINREIVPRASHASHEVREGDAIELVHLVGGG